MSHIARVGRGRARVRAGIAALYLVLVLGAITTVYPFLLMVSTATKSQVDYVRTFEVIPRYFVSDRALFTKYAEDRYANNLDDLNAAHGAAYAKVENAAPPAGASTAAARNLASDWNQFTRTLPPAYFKAGFGEHDNAPSQLLLRYRAHLREKFYDDPDKPGIDKLNELWTEENAGFNTVVPPFERTARREYVPQPSPKMADWTTFKARLPANFLVVQGVDPLYQRFLREERYQGDIARLNAVWGTNYADWAPITLVRKWSDAPPAQRADWEQFVRTKYPLRMLGMHPAALDPWRAFLAARGRAGAETAGFPNPLPAGGETLTDWMEFIKSRAPVDALVADSAENRWRAFLAQKYGEIEAANSVLGTRWASFGEAAPPQALADWQWVRQNAGALRGEFATRNFRAVADYILLHGGAVFNTVVFCVLAILAAVTVNPLCAYALSRYNLPYTYKVLLFLLATMAFPAEVAMIPNFLLLRDLHLLNTFAALVLPSLASGFSIFLLKGFFDSLPKELYEAGILDGATEITMFRRITVPLSLPIFSVIALGAFTASYGAFLFALVVCQDPNRWTLMVWLYDLQSAAPSYVIMAALTLAALPTLVVFLFAQKVIMRGIILPSFK